MKFLSAAVLFVVSLSATSGFAAERPNILFAFADDWGRYASAYAAADGSGSPNDIVKTPHFDRVAKDGVLFRHAFVTAPSCTPCRTSLMSGQYFYRTGLSAILQGARWDENTPAWPLLLHDAGYHIGKVYKVWSPGTPRDARSVFRRPTQQRTPRLRDESRSSASRRPARVGGWLRPIPDCCARPCPSSA